MAFYNENDPTASLWLRNLVSDCRIANGTVDHRSITELESDDVKNRQFHAFAGIGCWSLALRLAGVSDEAHVWTGSCPCQPFSIAGRRAGEDDSRHLFPVWLRLIEECRPPIIFGEQVASPDGRAWLDTVSAELEGLGYAIGSSDLCAAGLGAPHIRQRLFFVAHTEGFGRRGRRNPTKRHQRGREEGLEQRPLHRRALGLADPVRRGREASAALPDIGGDVGKGPKSGPRSDHSGEPRRLGDANGRRSEGDARTGDSAQGQGGRSRRPDWGQRHSSVASGAARGVWAGAHWIPCRDGKLRPAQPGAFPLADGTPERVGRLRAYGNAIIPSLAAQFILASLEAIEVSR